MNMRIQLLYFPSCPNADAARTRLRQALRRCGKALSWEEVDLDALGTSSSLRRFGSPSILIDGRDVCPDGAQRASGTTCCRVYPQSDIRGVPELEQLIASLSD